MNINKVVSDMEVLVFFARGRRNHAGLKQELNRERT